MKSIVTALFLLIGPAVVAQSVKPALPDIGLIQARAAQIEQMPAARTDTYSDSDATDVAVNSAFSSSSPAIGAALARSMTFVKPPSSLKFKTFSTSRLNRTLAATEFWTRGLDAFSTHRDLNNPCNCYHEGSRFLGMNMTPMLKTTAGAYSYSLGIAATYTFISSKLWNASRNHPRHARLLRTLSRTLLIGDSSMETAADIHNFSIKSSGPANQ
ncbi:MAG: hypothetical protein ACRD3N_19890 [Terracidiphilus sp.]